MTNVNTNILLKWGLNHTNPPQKKKKEKRTHGFKQQFSGIDIAKMFDFLIVLKCLLRFEDVKNFFQQTICIPMETNCAHFFADLFLYS